MNRPRRARFRHKSAAILLTVSLAVVPAALLSDRAEHAYGSTDPTAAAEPGDGAGSTESGNPVGVDGSLPSPPALDELMIEMPTPGPLGIPGSMLEAYRQAARTLGAELPDCGVDWALLASVGRSESNHARGGFVDADGTTRERITGPVLNGGPGVAAIRDTDGGVLDGDTTWDRAVGPMQFVPDTWRKYGADGNGDGRADPNNIHDATVTAGRYLCAGGTDLRNGGELRAALHRYNDSRSYVETVIRWAQAYRDGVLPIPDSDVPLGVPPDLVAEPPEPKPDRPPPPDVMAAPEPQNGGPRPGGGSGGHADGSAEGSAGDGGRPGSGSGEATAPKPGPHRPNQPGNGGHGDNGGHGGGSGSHAPDHGNGAGRPGPGGGHGDGSGDAGPGTGNPGTGNPGTGNPGTGNPGTGNPGTGNPGTGNPETGNPGTGNPGTGNPGNGGGHGDGGAGEGNDGGSGNGGGDGADDGPDGGDGDHGGGPGDGGDSGQPPVPECPRPDDSEESTDGAAAGQGSAGAGSAQAPTGDDSAGSSDETTTGEETTEPPSCVCPGHPDDADDDEVMAPEDCEWPEEESIPPPSSSAPLSSTPPREN